MKCVVFINGQSNQIIGMSILTEVAMTYKDELNKLTFNDYVNLITFLQVSDAYDLTDNLKRIRTQLLAKLSESNHE